MKRRRLRTDAVVPGSGGSDATISGESSNTSNTLNYSQLVVVGYTDRGIPLYDKKCLSNDNIRPYSDSCTDTTAAEDAKSDENDRDVGEGGNNNGSSSAAAAAAYYKYECISDRSCNTYDPGNNLDLGWTFIGICQYNSNCPDAYNTSTNSSTYYSTGDVVSVSSDYLNNNIIGSISCPTTDHGSSNSTMVDSSSMSMQSQNDSTSIIVPYLYEVETTQVISADIFLPRLEEQILLNLADSLMSCLDGDDSAANDVNSKYDIQGIDSSPDDVAINEGKRIYIRISFIEKIYNFFTYNIYYFHVLFPNIPFCVYVYNHIQVLVPLLAQRLTTALLSMVVLHSCWQQHQLLVIDRGKLLQTLSQLPPRRMQLNLTFKHQWKKMIYYHQ